MGYEAIVFDNDGTLVELTDWSVLRLAVATTFEQFGVPNPDDTLVGRFLSGVTIDDVETAADAHGFDPAEFWYRRDENAVLAQRIEIRGGRKTAYDDVGVLADLDVPLGIISANQHPTVESVLEWNGLAGRFDAVYGRALGLEGIRKKKPDTYYLDLALSDLDVDPGRVLYVGDNAVDVRMAHRAGADAALIERPHVDGVDAAPDYRIGGLEELRSLV